LSSSRPLSGRDAAFLNCLRHASAERSGYNRRVWLERQDRIVSLFVHELFNRFADPFIASCVSSSAECLPVTALDKIFGTFSPKAEALPALMLVGGWVEIVCGILVAFGLVDATRRVRRLR